MRYITRLNAVEESEVWCPGPLAGSVWLVNGKCVQWREALTGRRARPGGWHEVSPPVPPTGQVGRWACRAAPPLSPKLWKKALADA